MIGLVIALGYLTLAFLLDVRIKDEEELAEISKYPILGQIPDFALMNAHSGKHGYGYGYGTGSSHTPRYTLPDRKTETGHKEGEKA